MFKRKYITVYPVYSDVISSTFVVIVVRWQQDKNGKETWGFLIFLTLSPSTVKYKTIIILVHCNPQVDVSHCICLTVKQS